MLYHTTIIKDLTIIIAITTTIIIKSKKNITRNFNDAVAVVVVLLSRTSSVSLSQSRN